VSPVDFVQQPWADDGNNIIDAFCRARFAEEVLDQPAKVGRAGSENEIDRLREAVDSRQCPARQSDNELSKVDQVFLLELLHVFAAVVRQQIKNAARAEANTISTRDQNLAGLHSPARQSRRMDSFQRRCDLADIRPENTLLHNLWWSRRAGREMERCQSGRKRVIIINENDG